VPDPEVLASVHQEASFRLQVAAHNMAKEEVNELSLTHLECDFSDNQGTCRDICGALQSKQVAGAPPKRASNASGA
jgi:hypothetical protein